MRAFALSLGLLALAGCAHSPALKPYGGSVDQLFAQHRFAGAWSVPNMPTESRVVVLALEGGPAFVPLKGEFFKEEKDDIPGTVAKEVARGGAISAIDDNGRVIGYMVENRKEIPVGLQSRHVPYMQPDGGFTVRATVWDPSGGDSNGQP